MKQVLLIEDNWSDARTVERALRRLDPSPRLAIAASSDEARALLHETPDWDLVILDLHIGGDRGIDLLVTIREQFDRNELPVVILSGSDFGESIKEAYGLGASACLLKKTDYGLQVDQLLATYKFWTEVALHLPATGQHAALIFGATTIEQALNALQLDFVGHRAGDPQDRPNTLEHHPNQFELGNLAIRDGKPRFDGLQLVRDFNFVLTRLDVEAKGLPKRDAPYELPVDQHVDLPDLYISR